MLFLALNCGAKISLYFCKLAEKESGDVNDKNEDYQSFPGSMVGGFFSYG
jgi:hypothetical protein